jgi:hypothetical protein
MFSVEFVRPKRWPRLTLLLIHILVWGALPASDGTRRSFDLPADAADESLKRFSKLTELEVFYPSGATKGVRTQPVKGEMTAREALDAMLAGTGLMVVQDAQTGAFSVRRVHDPNGHRAAPTMSVDRPGKPGTLTSARHPRKP